MFVILGLDASSSVGTQNAAASKRKCPKFGNLISSRPKTRVSGNIQLAFSVSAPTVDPHHPKHYLHFATRWCTNFNASIAPNFATSPSTTATADTMTQTIIPDEDDVRDFVQDYSDIKRLTPSRANDLLDKIMADTQPEEPDADVS